MSRTTYFWVVCRRRSALQVQSPDVSSSATKNIGVPPDEIATAFASVCFPPSEAAHASSASGGRATLANAVASGTPMFLVAEEDTSGL